MKQKKVQFYPWGTQSMFRAKLPHGWLVIHEQKMVFVPLAKNGTGWGSDERY